MYDSLWEFLPLVELDIHLQCRPEGGLFQSASLIWLVNRVDGTVSRYYQLSLKEFNVYGVLRMLSF